MKWIGKSVEKESKLVLPRCFGGGGGGEGVLAGRRKRVTANEHGVSFWDDGSGDSGNDCTTL